MSKSDLILLALEESSIQNLMDRVLRAVKYETAIATNTKSLGKILQEATPGLLLIGEKFDGHDGVKIAKELQDRFPTLPVLLYTEKIKPELIKGTFPLGVERLFIPSAQYG